MKFEDKINGTLLFIDTPDEVEVPDSLIAFARMKAENFSGNDKREGRVQVMIVMPDFAYPDCFGWGLWSVSEDVPCISVQALYDTELKVMIMNGGFIPGADDSWSSHT